MSHELNWCKFVLGGLTNSTDKVRKYPNENRACLKGCTFLLEIFYRDNLSSNVVLPPCQSRIIPRIGDWINEMLRKIYVRVNRDFDGSSITVSQRTNIIEDVVLASDGIELIILTNVDDL